MIKKTLGNVYFRLALWLLLDLVVSTWLMLEMVGYRFRYAGLGLLTPLSMGDNSNTTLSLAKLFEVLYFVFSPLLWFGGIRNLKIDRTLKILSFLVFLTLPWWWMEMVGRLSAIRF